MNAGKALLLVSCAWATAASANPTADVSAVDEPIAQVEVVGTRPGPQMWKVSRDNHVLWIMGTLQPLPKRMTWQSTEVEKVLKDAQEVVPFDFELDADITPMEAIRLFLQWHRSRLLADGTTLQDVMPAPLYTRFVALSRKYARSESRFSRQQPMMAGSQLRNIAISESGLSTSADIQRIVLKLAHKHGVKVRSPHLLVTDPKAALTEFVGVPLDAQLRCLEPTLATLESDMGTLRARAVAWAAGDVDQLRSLPVADVEIKCWQAMTGSPHLRELAERAHTAWIRTVEGALAKNETTLALLPMGQLLGPHGGLMTLSEAGYNIEGPEYASR